jgi:hypothetical protein
MPTPCIRFDVDRDKRIGLPEAVFCEGKPRRALLTLLERFADPSEKPILFTRLDADFFESLPSTLKSAYNYDPISRTAWCRTLPGKARGEVAVVSAGTADGAVAREVSRTLEYLGWKATRYEDCGVAGLWRIQSAIEDINKADVVVVIAGLDAAIASVVGGLTSKPLFAVPTSIGYGIAEHGKSALTSMLVSCAPGIGVFNIDNGYGAACAAARVLNAIYREQS